MKKLILFLFAFLPLFTHAQSEVASDASVTVDVPPTASFKFGYFSYQSVFTTVPDYAIAQRNLANLQNKFDAEAKRVEQEFNKKYEEFLDGQKDFPPTILQKRQKELQELMEKNIAFKDESKRLLDQAKKDAYAPIYDKINKVVQMIGKDKGYAFVLNTDDNACPFVDSKCGENITELIKRTLE